MSETLRKEVNLALGKSDFYKLIKEEIKDRSIEDLFANHLNGRNVLEAYFLHPFLSWDSDLIDIVRLFEERGGLEGMRSSDFLVKMGHQIYSEWCIEHCSDKSQPPKDEAYSNWAKFYTISHFANNWIPPESYQGKGFAKFLNDETHYELNRQGIEFNGRLFLKKTGKKYKTWNEGKSELKDLMYFIDYQTEYLPARFLVTRALVDRSIEFFRENPEAPTDKEFLRCSLEPYIEAIKQKDKNIVQFSA